MASAAQQAAGSSDDEGLSIRRAQLGAQIAGILRQDILFGRIATGSKLSQQELCDRFGTSRMPVRDALRELVYSGLLIQDDGRHAVVAPLHEADVLDSFAIEGMLSGLAVRKATALAAEDDLHELEALDDRMHEVLVAGEVDKLPTLNWQFHRRINYLANSPKLLAAIRVVTLEVPRDYLAELPTWAERSNREHTEIVAAMRAGDGARAEAIMVDHFTSSGEGLTGILRSRGVRMD
jgi:DNA-binding GntR family transcriptional regulator